jgi:hypothetical protein
MAHYIGVDLHKAFFQVCTGDETGTRCWDAVSHDIGRDRGVRGAGDVDETLTTGWSFGA